jgi:HSP20 family molecular chaperone IbpA
MAHLSNIFHHFAFTHPQSDPSLLDAPRDAADNFVLSLKVDFHEYTSAYFLEVELPGIQKSNDIDMRWLDGSTLQIQVSIPKTDLEAEWGDAISHDKPHEKVQSASKYEEECDERNSFGARTGKQEVGERRSPERLMTKLWLNERRTGVYMRNFYFPIAVDTDAIQVRLRQGLLKVFVPKVDAASFETKHIKIEAM